MLRNPVETDKGCISNCVKNRSKNSRHARGKGDGRIVKYEGVKLEEWWMCWQELQAVGMPLVSLTLSCSGGRISPTSD
jgi:hypothetical protein